MKKIFALLVALCMLFSCTAFAETAQPTPEDTVSMMLDQGWNMLAATIMNYTTMGLQTVQMFTQQAADSVSTWLDSTDQRFKENKESLVDGVMKLLPQVAEAATALKGEVDNAITKLSAGETDETTKNLSALAQLFFIVTGQNVEDNTRLAEGENSAIGMLSYVSYMLEAVSAGLNQFLNP